jgi:hypothetical protein
MAKRTPQTNSRQKSKSPRRAKKSLAELNAWLSANHDQLLDAARRNCLKLTGKQTFGAGRKRKSA